MSITNRQISAATSLLGLYTKQISEYTGISERQLSAYNTGKSNLSQDNINKLTQFFDNRGLIFTAQGGVDFRPPEVVRVLSGQDGFRALMDDVYRTATNEGGRIEILNGSPSLFTQHLGAEWYEMHAKRMLKTKNNIQFRIVAKKGETPIASAFAQYRWMNEGEFYNQSVYIYGNAVAFIAFEDPAVSIEIIKRDAMVKTFHAIFDLVWAQL